MFEGSEYYPLSNTTLGRDIRVQREVCLSFSVFHELRSFALLLMPQYFLKVTGFSTPRGNAATETATHRHDEPPIHRDINTIKVSHNETTSTGCLFFGVIISVLDQCIFRATDKCLVFSQWDDMLDIVELAFKENQVR